MGNRAVIIFLRAPEKGRVKTRLTRRFDKGFVLDLYKAFVLDTIEAATGTADIHLFFWPVEKEDLIRRWLGEKYSFTAQSGSTLGEKMANAFRQIFEKGYHQAILIGTDIPQLDAALINAAFEKLKSNDVMLGPSEDSGYYLIGFNRNSYETGVFEDIDWSTPKVLDQTLERLHRMNKKTGRIDTLNDIDTPRDFEKLVGLMKEGHYIGPETRKKLCSL